MTDVVTFTSTQDAIDAWTIDASEEKVKERFLTLMERSFDINKIGALLDCMYENDMINGNDLDQLFDGDLVVEQGE